MRINCLSILLLVLFSSFFSNAQNNLKGIVKTQDGTTIPFATVQLKSVYPDNKTIAFTTSDKEGNFTLSINNTGSFLLVISHISFERNEQELTIKEGETIAGLEIILEPKTQELNEVTIQKSMTAAWEKGDTITYSTQAFTTGKEVKLKDVLNKLPGIEVSENGQIIANGKKVDHLLIDGKEFFGDNHGLATNNLAAEMIAGVDLVKNYESFGALREIDESKQTALNIKIKSDYKNKISGDITAYGAIENRYRLHTNLFRFGKTLNLSFIGNLNDTGEQALSLQDYLNLNTTIKDEIRNSGSLSEETLTSLPDFLLSDNNVQERSTQFGALNFSYFPSGKLNIHGYTILNNNKQTENIISQQRFLESNLVFSDSINTKGKLLFNQTKVNVDYKPNGNNFINYTLLLEPTDNSETRNVTSVFQNERQLFQESSDATNLKVGQQLSYISKIGAYELLTFNLFHEKTSFKTDYELEANQTLFDSSFSSFFQDKTRDFEEYGILGKYTRKFKNTLFKAQLGTIFKKEELFSEIPDRNILSNDLIFEKNYFMGRISFEKNEGFFRYLVGSEIRRYSLDFADQKSTPTFFLPDLELKLAFSGTQDLSFYYKKNIDFAPVDQLNEQNIIKDYRNLYVASTSSFERDLATESIGLRYFYLELYSGTLLLVNSGFSETKNYITLNSTSSRFNSIGFQNSPSYKKWFNNVMFETRFSKIKTKLRVNAGYNRLSGFNYLNGIESDVLTQTFTSRASFLSYFKKSWFNYEAGIKFREITTTFSGLNTKNKNTVYTPYANFEVSFSDALLLNLSNNYEIFQSNDEERSFFNFGFRSSYHKEDSSFRFFLEGNNVFNLSNPEVIEIRSDNNIFERNVLSRLAGYIGFGITYEF
ncbi:carboxypeptidase-like regulatory domain-containing protein [Flavobacteriaceae bacterium M23B6Z8]